MRGLTIKVESLPHNGGLSLKCVGSIDAHTYDQLERDLDMAIEGSPGGITIDLSQVTYISSAGLGVLLNVNGIAEDRGIALSILDPGEGVREVLAATGLDGFLPIVCSSGGEQARSA